MSPVRMKSKISSAHVREAAYTVACAGYGLLAVLSHKAATASFKEHIPSCYEPIEIQRVLSECTN